MKFILWLLLSASVCLHIQAQSCCCTGAGSNYTILPNLNRHVIGLRYTFKNYYSVARSLNPELDGDVTRQHLHTTELFGRFNMTNRLQLSVFVPVNYITQHTAEEKTNAHGLGDISFLLQYNLINPLRCTGRNDKHQLRLGIGSKLPSGDFRMSDKDLFLTNLQLGTGSVDFISSVIYTFRIKGWGVNTAVAYKLNTVNPQHYRFGDRLQAGINAFYVFETNQGLQLMPSIALNYEYQLHNRHKGKLLTFTGGQFLNASVGFDIYYKRFAFSSAFSPALMNQLNWSGENRNRFNFEAGVFYNFSTQTKNN